MVEKQLKQFKKALKNLKYINVDAIFTDENDELVCSGNVDQQNLVYC
jgi:ferredoxin-fold anticodon binding domain-containing protein